MEAAGRSQQLLQIAVVEYGSHLRSILLAYSKSQGLQVNQLCHADYIAGIACLMGAPWEIELRAAVQEELTGAFLGGKKNWPQLGLT